MHKDNIYIKLRDYQLECLDTVIKEFTDGINRQLVILPTGSGKTIIMAAISKHFNKKTLVVAHREELISQAEEKFKLLWPDADIGICMAEKNEMDNQIILGSIQSCSRPKRLNCLKEKGVEILIIDESHHSASESYQKVIEELGFKKDTKKLLLGVTATPQRSDKLELGETFSKVVFNRSISTMIRAGYLAPVIGRKILTSFKIGKIKVSHGDFALADLSEAVNTEERNNFIAAKFKEYASDRKAICFCCDVKHCKDLAEAFKRLGIEAKPVWGDMCPIERKNTLEAFKKGELQILTSCGILIEGYDEPSVNAIIMARPTRSHGLYIQCVGRGLRNWPGKQNCLVLDFTDQNHDLDSVVYLSDAVPEATYLEEKEEIEREKIDRQPRIDISRECDEEFDILATSRFLWIEIEGEWSLQDDDGNEILMSVSEGGYIASLYSNDGSSEKIVSKPLPLEYCSGVCEDYARKNLKIFFADMSHSWMNGKIATEGQRDFLEREGAYQEGMSKMAASIAIRKIISKKNKQKRILNSEPLTNKQKYFLNQHGIKTDGISKLQAMRTISQIKQQSVSHIT